MDLARAGNIVAIMLSPTIIVGAVFYLPRALRALEQHLVDRDAAVNPRPSYPPIEQLAADLRRLLDRHASLRASPTVAVRAKHLLALEAAITDCAIDAARALDLPCPARPARGGLPKPQLRALLTDLAGAGLVLPPTHSLLTA